LIREPTILKISRNPDFLYSSSDVLPTNATYPARQMVNKVNVASEATIMKEVGGTAPFSSPRVTIAITMVASHPGIICKKTDEIDAVAFLL
jgi:hypothetical protein